MVYPSRRARASLEGCGTQKERRVLHDAPTPVVCAQALEGTVMSAREPVLRASIPRGEFSTYEVHPLSDAVRVLYTRAEAVGIACAFYALRCNTTQNERRHRSPAVWLSIGTG